ncbi:fatty acid synthase [Holotrichia oblita]|uniref:Fatty acid synthase n=1 Tax=Holotrichia oblita TaxID=644536 RepID=A0ACB9TDD5_HOLOL|nr:fatty acid synthase [Holotrichia oblita]
MECNECYCDGSDTYEDPMQPDTIVITGMSGNFAAADNTLQFYESLCNKKLYFRISTGITRRQSNSMDPAFRLLLERVFEAIIDGGYSPSEFVDTNTGVFASCGILETERGVFYEELNHFSDAITGAQRSLMAKLISYHFKLKSLSFQVDAACCGSLFALEHAYVAIKEGKCDKAIVCGENLCLQPSLSLELARLGVASRDGKSKTFDNTVDGYARSEAVVVLLLERATDAKRVYAEVVHVKTSCDGYKIEGITFPNIYQKKQMMLDFYNECNIDRKTISFVEAHGTGTAVGDREELNCMDEVMCQDRKDPLYIGAVKSNLGHTEAASGICSIVKVIRYLSQIYFVVHSSEKEN